MNSGLASFNLAHPSGRILLAESSVPAGFPSPAEDSAQGRIDLTEAFVLHPACTFFQRATGRSMEGVGIFDGDYLVVDRILEPVQGDVVVAVIENEFTVKLLHLRPGIMRLKAASPLYPDIIPKPGQTLEIRGVVTSSIRIHRDIRNVRTYRRK